MEYFHECKRSRPNARLTVKLLAKESIPDTCVILKDTDEIII